VEVPRVAAVGGAGAPSLPPSVPATTPSPSGPVVRLPAGGSPADALTLVSEWSARCGAPLWLCDGCLGDLVWAEEQYVLLATAGCSPFVRVEPDLCLILLPPLHCCRELARLLAQEAMFSEFAQERAVFAASGAGAGDGVVRDSGGGGPAAAPAAAGVGCGASSSSVHAASSSAAEEYTTVLADVERLEGQLSLLKSRMRSLRVLDPSGSVAGTLARWVPRFVCLVVTVVGMESWSWWWGSVGCLPFHGAPPPFFRRTNRGWRELTALSFVNACGLEAIRADKSLTTQYRTTVRRGIPLSPGCVLVVVPVAGPRCVHTGMSCLCARPLALQLSKLQHITIFNDAFFIWHDGQYGTINGLRLGCVNGQPVRWSGECGCFLVTWVWMDGCPQRRGEAKHTACLGTLCSGLQVDWMQVNAAMGYVALLLAAVCSQTGCKFSEYVAGCVPCWRQQMRDCPGGGL
jgi:hypothetical protein